MELAELTAGLGVDQVEGQLGGTGEGGLGGKLKGVPQVGIGLAGQP